MGHLACLQLDDINVFVWFKSYIYLRLNLSISGAQCLTLLDENGWYCISSDLIHIYNLSRSTLCKLMVYLDAAIGYPHVYYKFRHMSIKWRYSNSRQILDRVFISSDLVLCVRWSLLARMHILITYFVVCINTRHFIRWVKSWYAYDDIRFRLHN